MALPANAAERFSPDSMNIRSPDQDLLKSGTNENWSRVSHAAQPHRFTQSRNSQTSRNSRSGSLTKEISRLTEDPTSKKRCVTSADVLLYLLLIAEKAGFDPRKRHRENRKERSEVPHIQELRIKPANIRNWATITESTFDLRQDLNVKRPEWICPSGRSVRLTVRLQRSPGFLLPGDTNPACRRTC